MNLVGDNPKRADFFLEKILQRHPIRSKKLWVVGRGSTEKEPDYYVQDLIQDKRTLNVDDLLSLKNPTASMAKIMHQTSTSEVQEVKANFITGRQVDRSMKDLRLWTRRDIKKYSTPDPPSSIQNQWETQLQEFFLETVRKDTHIMQEIDMVLRSLKLEQLKQIGLGTGDFKMAMAAEQKLLKTEFSRDEYKVILGSIWKPPWQILGIEPNELQCKELDVVVEDVLPNEAPKVIVSLHKKSSLSPKSKRKVEIPGSEKSKKVITRQKTQMQATQETARNNILRFDRNEYIKTQVMSQKVKREWKDRVLVEERDYHKEISKITRSSDQKLTQVRTNLEELRKSIAKRRGINTQFEITKWKPAELKDESIRLLESKFKNETAKRIASNFKLQLGIQMLKQNRIHQNQSEVSKPAQTSLYFRIQAKNGSSFSSGDLAHTKAPHHPPEKAPLHSQSARSSLPTHKSPTPAGSKHPSLPLTTRSSHPLHSHHPQTSHSPKNPKPHLPSPPSPNPKPHNPPSSLHPALPVRQPILPSRHKHSHSTSNNLSSTLSADILHLNQKRKVQELFATALAKTVVHKQKLLERIHSNQRVNLD